jgi:hypothetical protein
VGGLSGRESMLVCPSKIEYNSDAIASPKRQTQPAVRGCSANMVSCIRSGIAGPRRDIRAGESVPITAASVLISAARELFTAMAGAPP